MIKVISVVKDNFEVDRTQNYLVFQPVCRYFKKIANSDHILAWKYKRLSDKSCKSPVTSNNSLVPSLN